VDGRALTTSARYGTPWGELVVVYQTPAFHVAYDGTAALATAHALGLYLPWAAEALAAYQPVGMRLRAEEIGGVLVLNDAYNANPDSMRAAFDTLARLDGRRVAVIGDMLELGDDEDRWHQQVAAEAGEHHFDLVVLVGPRMARAAGRCVGAGEVWADADPLAVVPSLRGWLREGDRLLVKASRGTRLERLLQRLRDSEERG